MSAFQLLKSSEGKPYHGYSQLPMGNHEIFAFRLVRNKLYRENDIGSLKRVLLVELKDQILYLPNHFAAKFKDDDSRVNELNTDGIKKFLFFGGKRER